MGTNATIYREYTFESCHWLPRVPSTHKCSRAHGHSYVIRVHVTGPVDPHFGWVIDFADIDRVWLPLHAILDHHTLNEVDGLDNPTSENLAIWLWDRFQPRIRGLCRIEVSETVRSGCVYEGPAPHIINQLTLSTVQAVGVDVVERDIRGKGGQS